MKRTEGLLKSSRAIAQGFSTPVTVLFIATRSDGGDTAQHIVELMRALKPTGVRLLIASPLSPPFGIEFKKLADIFIPIPAGKFSIGAYRDLKKFVRKNHVNIVHSHGRHAGVYSRLLGSSTTAAVVHSYHGINVERGFRGFVRKAVDQLLARYNFLPLFFSKTERDHAIQERFMMANREAQMIEPSVDLGRFPERKGSAAAFGRIDRAKPETYGQIRVGALLRSASAQSIDIFLRLAKESAALGQFTCAGISREQLKKFGPIPPNLEILGANADVGAWMSSLDVFVSTSTGNGQFVAALEAMAAGAVCLLSSIRAHGPFLKHQAAVVFDPNSVAMFKSKLTEIRGDKSLRGQLLGNSRYMIERFHDSETLKTRITEIYREAMKWQRQRAT